LPMQPTYATPLDLADDDGDYDDDERLKHM
jgi:hypothetical protein